MYSLLLYAYFFCFKQKTAYEMRISDWSSDVCSSDLGDRFLASIDEAIAIGRAARTPVELYHLKVGGRENWSKMTTAIQRIEAARASGVRVTADVYPYIASSTGLDAAMPPWVREGGTDAWIARLRDPAVRRRVVREMRAPGDWENVLRMAGPDKAHVAGGIGRAPSRERVCQ